MSDQIHEKKPKSDYEGGQSTLCVGCGHDLITSAIIDTFYKLQISPTDVIKMSGIGCSSKTPGYFLGRSHGINSMHGRMAPISTGAYLVKNKKYYIGISGDGDTASIGLGGFCHMIRRNPRMVYIVANNGVYGLTKGQFSPTSEIESFTKTQKKNEFESIDLCSLALNLGCDFVARAFVGDQKQFTKILELAIKHKGLAFIDVISPCVSFNNHDESHMGFKYVRTHKKNYYEIESASDEQKSYETLEPNVYSVKISESETVLVRSIEGEQYNPKSKESALSIVDVAKKSGYIPTGLIYLNPESLDLVDRINLGSENLGEFNSTDRHFDQNFLDELLKEYK